MSQPTPVQAMERLSEGNERYISDACLPCEASDSNRRTATASGQAPFAVVLSCADSRVPVEILFHQGVGDLFVIRVAGNIATPSQIGSIEFAVANFGSPLVVVLGHTSCGAVAATLEELRSGPQDLPPNLQSIVDGVRPAVEPVWKEHAGAGDVDLLTAAVHANVHAVVRQLKADSDLLHRRSLDGSVSIVGAEYALDTGAVTFLSPSDGDRT